MSGMKSIVGMFAMMTAMASACESGYSEMIRYQELIEGEKSRLKAIAENKRLERFKQKGVNEYF